MLRQVKAVGDQLASLVGTQTYTVLTLPVDCVEAGKGCSGWEGTTRRHKTRRVILYKPRGALAFLNTKSARVAVLCLALLLCISVAVQLSAPSQADFSSSYGAARQGRSLQQVGGRRLSGHVQQHGHAGASQWAARSGMYADQDWDS